MGPHRGFAERPYYRDHYGHAYVQRTYWAHGHAYAYAYRDHSTVKQTLLLVRAGPLLPRRFLWLGLQSVGSPRLLQLGLGPCRPMVLRRLLRPGALLPHRLTVAHRLPAG